MSKRFSKFNPPAKRQGVRFFEQFLKNFVRPYGPTKEAPGEETILKRLQSYNCELLTRPRIGMSELSASIDGPLQAILESNSKLVHTSGVKKLANSMKELTDGLEPFNTKRVEEGETSKGERKEATEDVKKVLRYFFKEGENIEDAIGEAFVLASNLLTLSTNYLVARRTLFTNAEEYAQKCQIDGDEGKDFKKAGTVKGLKELLKKTCLTQSTVGKKEMMKKKKKLYLELESTDEEGSKEVENRKKEKKRKRVVKEEEEVEESEMEEVKEEIEVPKKKGKKEKKRRVAELEDEDEE